MRTRSTAFFGAALCALLGTAVATLAAAPPAPRKAAPPAHDHRHGPHGGELLGLGDEEFHAEIVHDGRVKVLAVYILDSTGKKAVAIDAKELLVNVRRNGRAEQYRIPAEPQDDDPAGVSSLFATKDETLQAILDAHGVDARLQVSIGGNAYSAKIVHHHHH